MEFLRLEKLLKKAFWRDPGDGAGPVNGSDDSLKGGRVGFETPWCGVDFRSRLVEGVLQPDFQIREMDFLNDVSLESFGEVSKIDFVLGVEL